MNEQFEMKNYFRIKILYTSCFHLSTHFNNTDVRQQVIQGMFGADRSFLLSEIKL